MKNKRPKKETRTKEECLLSTHIPNQVTKNSIENVENNRDLTTIRNFQDLLQKIDTQSKDLSK